MSIEGNPFITRFKTSRSHLFEILPLLSIEGNPFITRFKTKTAKYVGYSQRRTSIEGNPFITRFKTTG